jgi:flavin-dependent dehydrogenase
LYAAQLLAESGRRVAVFERQQQLGTTRRTWIVTDELEKIAGFIPSRAIVNRIDRIEMFSRSRANEVQLSKPDLIVERALMQPLLAERAQSAGVELYLDHGVRQMSFGPAGTELEISANALRRSFKALAPVLIGADGVRSLVARQLNASPQVAAPIVQARVRLPAGYNPSDVRVWFQRQDTRFFYWLIPESEEYGVAGLVAESTANARVLLDTFLVQQHLRPLNYQGAIIPLHQPFRQIEWRRGSARAMLVGDAAAHVKVTTVGGLVSGLWGGRAAAESIIANTSYSRNLQGLHRELYLHDFIRWLLDRFNDADYDRLLAALNPRLKQVLAECNRDSMALAALSLVTAQPALLGLGAKALLWPNLSPAARRDSQSMEPLPSD